MTKKKSTPVNYIHQEPMAELKKANPAEQTAGEILTAIRQLEPENQNEVIKTVLKELAIDRHNSVRQCRDAADRASKNMDVFMYNAIGLEKVMAEANDRKG
jgi:hypothetical protein